MSLINMFRPLKLYRIPAYQRFFQYFIKPNPKIKSIKISQIKFLPSFASQIQNASKIGQFYFRHYNNIYKMSKQYNFAFMFSRIELSERQSHIIQPFTHFKIQLYSNKHFIGSTNQFLAALDHKNNITLEQEIIQFTFIKTQHNFDQNCEIRFCQIMDRQISKTIGVYQFILNNYIIAYAEYNKNIVELNVQINPNYSIIYDVFIERTTEALKNIIKEHQFTRKIQKDGVKENSFYPEEICNDYMNFVQKEINYDQNSPAIMRKRYWSPTRKKKTNVSLKHKARIFKSEEKSKQTQDTQMSNSNRVTYVRITRRETTFSELADPTTPYNLNNIQSMRSAQAEIESYPNQNEQQFQRKEKLVFNVIQLDSKISNDCQSNDSFSNKQYKTSLISDSQLYIKKQIKMAKSGYIKIGKTIFMLIVLIFLLATLLNLMGKPTLRIPRRKVKRNFV